MNAEWRQLLKQEFPELPVRENVSFREVTSWGIGGTLPLLAEPAGDVELSALYKFLQKNKVPSLLIGGGTNMAGCDKIFEGASFFLRGAHARGG